jgi:transposase
MPVAFMVERRHYLCNNCHKHLVERPTLFDPHRNMTVYLVRFVERHVLSEKIGFANIARRTSLKERTIEDIYKDLIGRLDARRPIVAPTWLGMARVRGQRGSEKCILLCDVDTGRVLTIVSDEPSAVRATLTRLTGQSPIRRVTLDFHDPLRELVGAILPEAIRGVDEDSLATEFAEVSARVWSQAIDDLVDSNVISDDERYTFLRQDLPLLIRRPDQSHRPRAELAAHERNIINKWIRPIPELGAAYRLKERFWRLWDLTTPANAKEEVATWLDDADAAFSPESLHRPYLTPMLDLISKMRVWRDEIANSIENRVPKGYTSQIHRVRQRVEDLQKLGRGYSCPVLRGRMLYEPNDLALLYGRDDVDADTSGLMRLLNWADVNRPRHAMKREPDNGIDLHELSRRLQREELLHKQNKAE